MTTVISVRFRNGSKTYFFDPGALQISAGQDVVVETAQGLEFAHCTEGNHEVNDTAVVQPLRTVARVATENDYRTDSYNRTREKEAFDVCQKKILQHGLEMKLVRVECSFDGSKILFFFTADGRVDFRELVKDLAGVFRARIELRQIGVRDEAKMLGGLGICGKPFCCSTYMDDFVPVSIKMAKTQNLSLNPTKISGTCGRLMCCLNYEQCIYEEALKVLPKADSFVLTPDGPGNVADVNVLKETVNVKLDDKPEAPHCYHNCEVCVLRSGKGSRDGITIPDKLPERYVEKKEELLPEIVPGSVEEWAESMTQSSAEKEGHRRNRRRSSHRGKGTESARRVESHVEEKESVPAPEKERGTTHRAGRNHRGKKPARSEKPAVQTAQPVSAIPARSDTEAPRQSGGDAVKHRSRHRSRPHRGGKKPNGGGGE